MRIHIAPEKCIASGGCRRAAPQLFGQDDDGVVTLLDPAPARADQAAARQAAITCPAAVIAIEAD